MRNGEDKTPITRLSRGDESGVDAKTISSVAIEQNRIPSVAIHTLAIKNRHRYIRAIRPCVQPLGDVIVRVKSAEHFFAFEQRFALVCHRSRRSTAAFSSM
jgi:hypothetical protein